MGLPAAMLGGAAISGLLGLFGQDKQEDAAHAQAQANEALQREFAQQGIRWRVADAKAAGLHPLFALGGSGAAFSPNPITVGGNAFSEMGQSLGRAVAAQQSSEERTLHELQRRLIESQIGEHDARAAALRSQATRPSVGQAGIGFPDAGGSGADVFTRPYIPVGEPGIMQLNPVGDYSSGYPGKYDMVKPKPVEIESVSADAPWTTAGPARPGFQRFQVTKYLEMVLPTNEEGWSEGIESVPIWMWPMVYQANVDKYGPDFWRVAIQELGARTPFSRWLSQQERPRFDKFSPGGWGNSLDSSARFGVYPHMKR